MSRKTHLFCDRLLWVLFLGVSIIGRKLPRLVRMNSPSESDSPQSFDVFLCYNSKDKSAIRAIAQQLSDRGISYWLDEEQLLPGTYWLDTQERDMSRLKTVAIFIGQHGIGRW
jgi:TIR domain